MKLSHFCGWLAGVLAAVPLWAQNPPNAGGLSRQRVESRFRAANSATDSAQSERDPSRGNDELDLVTVPKRTVEEPKDSTEAGNNGTQRIPQTRESPPADVDPPVARPPIQTRVTPQPFPDDEVLKILKNHEDRLREIAILLSDRPHQTVPTPPVPGSERTNATGYIIAAFAHLLAFMVALVGLREFWVAARQLPSGAGTQQVGVKAQTGDTGTPPPSKPELLEVEVKVQGIAIKTSRISGLLLLAASLAFYFLYIRFVYPITVP